MHKLDLKELLPIQKSTRQHLRLGFSLFLLPIFVFASAASGGGFSFWQWLAVGFILHILLYPASNGYNSWFDKDEKSIGGLKSPPPVFWQLYFYALGLDLVAIISGLLISGWLFALMLLVYGLVSKAYSHPRIRLKKYPWASWFAATLFQGAFTYWMTLEGLEVPWPSQSQHLWGGIICTVMLASMYPISQMYQHEEDGSRGDLTLSRVLGIKGTFMWAMGWLIVTFLAFVLYFYRYGHPLDILLFILCLAPLVLYFVNWMSKVWRNPTLADHTHVTTLNYIATVCLNLFFILWYFLGWVQWLL